MTYDIQFSHLVAALLQSNVPVGSANSQAGMYSTWLHDYMITHRKLPQ